MDKEALRSSLMSALDALGSTRDDDPKEIIQAVADAETQVIEAEAKAQADAQTQVIEAAAEAQGDAQEQVVEAKAQADADAQEQVIRAQADTTVDFVQNINDVDQPPPQPVQEIPSDPLLLADTPELDEAGNIIGDGARAADQLGDFIEQPGDPSEPLSDSVTVGETGRATTDGDAVDVLEGLIEDSEDVVDIAPAPTHWYTRQRSFRRSRR